MRREDPELGAGGCAILFVIAVMVILSMLMLAGCSPRVVERIVTRDTTIIEIHERIVHDTATFHLPPIVETVTTPDTTSHLENDYAESDATWSNGMLTHSLRTKPQDIDVPVAIPVADTTTTHSSYNEHTEFAIEEIEKPISAWKQTKIRAFWPLVIALVVALLWIFRKPILRIVGIIK